MDRWKLEDAKARFSEVVRGHDAVVVMSVEEFDRLVRQAGKVPAEPAKRSVEITT